MNGGELIKLNILKNEGSILSKEFEKIIFNNKKYIKTTILYLFHDESSKTDVQFKSCKIASNKKKSIIKCYNDLIEKKDLVRLYNWGLIIDKDDSPSIPSSSEESKEKIDK